MIVVAAGPVFNFVLAWLLFWGLLVAEGRFEMLPVVGQVQKDSPAELAASRPEIPHRHRRPGRGVMGRMATAIRAGGGRTVTLTCAGRDEPDRGRDPTIRTVKNLFGEEEKAPLVGIVATGKTRAVPVGTVAAAGEAVRQTWNVLVVTYTGLLKLIERVVPLDSLGGPIMIAQMVSKQAAEGLGNVGALAALISVNLGVLNLLPIPVLDGGQPAFLSWKSSCAGP
jgi:regulator of sigma E protease